MKRKHKAKAYSFRHNIISELEEVIYEVNSKDYMSIYYSNTRRCLVIVSNIDDRTRFLRQLNYQCGEFQIYCSQLHRLLERQGVDDKIKLRYRHRITIIGSLFDYIAKKLYNNKTNKK